MKTLDHASRFILLLSMLLPAIASRALADPLALTPGTHGKTLSAKNLAAGHSPKNLAAGHAPVQRKLTRSTLPPAKKTSRSSLNKTLDPAKDQKDSIADMGQTQMSQLKMEMDRKSKLEQTMSDTMKKDSDSKNSLTGNLK